LEERAIEGDPRFPGTQDILDFPRVLAADRPVLLEMITDPEIPLLPPEITIALALKASR
jgi:hypothetical protein